MPQPANDATDLQNTVIGVIGLGYVGLPLSLRFAEAGYKVIGFDIDQSKAEQLNSGQSYIRHFGDEKIRAANAAGFEASTDFSRTSEADALIICVPTPLKEHREPDISFVTNTMDSLLPYLREGQVVSLESTTYPGTTDDIIVPALDEVGLELDRDVWVAFSPERVSPGDALKTVDIPKLVGGVTEASTEVATAAYRRLVASVHPVSTAAVAEMAKLFENTYRAVNIGLANEMALMCDRMGIDTWEVIRAAATKPFGFMPFYPGPGLGGHCIPVDPHYLAWKMRTLNYKTRFIDLASEINAEMPLFVVDKVREVLNRKQRSVNGSRIVLLGIAYKRDIDDVRESPALDVLKLLEADGADVVYHDPYVPEWREDGTVLVSQDLTDELLNGADADTQIAPLLIVTVTTVGSTRVLIIVVGKVSTTRADNPQDIAVITDDNVRIS